MEEEGRVNGRSFTQQKLNIESCTKVLNFSVAVSRKCCRIPEKTATFKKVLLYSRKCCRISESGVPGCSYPRKSVFIP